MHSMVFEDYGPFAVISMMRTPTADEWEEYLGTLDARLAAQTRFVVIFDTTRHPGLPQALRARQGAWLKQNEQAIARHCMGTAFAFSSPLSRFVLSSIFLVRPLAAPYDVCASRREALTWAGEALRKVGVETSPHLEEALAGHP